MSRVVPFLLKRPPPAVADRAALGRLVDNLQILTTDCPAALAALAIAAERLAAPYRRRLPRPAKATLRLRLQKQSS
jgi:hypothetical protein